MPEENRRQELRKTLKKKTLYRVLSTESEATVHSIINQNAMFAQMRHLRNDIPEEHRKEIALIKQEQMLIDMLCRKFNELGLSIDILEPVPRAIKQLNLLEKLEGNSRQQWSYNGYNLDDLLSLVHIAPASMTIH